jgi:hypothetical protein
MMLVSASLLLLSHGLVAAQIEDRGCCQLQDNICIGRDTKEGCDSRQGVFTSKAECCVGKCCAAGEKCVDEKCACVPPPLGDGDCKCTLGITISNRSVKPGDPLSFTISLTHSDPQTVERTFVMWIEDQDGTSIVSQESPTYTIHYLDVLTLPESLTLPSTTPPGVYRLTVAMGGMLQGVAEHHLKFEVVK